MIQCKKNLQLCIVTHFVIFRHCLFHKLFQPITIPCRNTYVKQDKPYILMKDLNYSHDPILLFPIMKMVNTKQVFIFHVPGSEALHFPKH
jgi:hypothetical protein